MRSMLASKLLDLTVLFEIGLGLILDIMVQGHDDLVVAGFDLLALCDADGVALDDLLGERLGRSGGRWGGEGREVGGVG
jgi:hypothetical protein